MEHLDHQQVDGLLVAVAVVHTQLAVKVLVAPVVEETAAVMVVPPKQELQILVVEEEEDPLMNLEFSDQQAALELLLSGILHNN
jgi:hypothetical protein